MGNVKLNMAFERFRPLLCKLKTSWCVDHPLTGFEVWGLVFGVWGLGFGVWDLGFGVRGLKFGFGVWVSGFGFWGLGFWV